MIDVSLSLIERDVTKISPKIRLHWDIRRTVNHFRYTILKYISIYVSQMSIYETTDQLSCKRDHRRRLMMFRKAYNDITQAMHSSLKHHL